MTDPSLRMGFHCLKATEPQRRDSLLFTTQFPGLLGTQPPNGFEVGTPGLVIFSFLQCQLSDGTNCKTKRLPELWTALNGRNVYLERQDVVESSFSKTSEKRKNVKKNSCLQLFLSWRTVDWSISYALLVRHSESQTFLGNI